MPQASNYASSNIRWKFPKLQTICFKNNILIVGHGGGVLFFRYVIGRLYKFLIDLKCKMDIKSERCVYAIFLQWQKGSLNIFISIDHSIIRFYIKIVSRLASVTYPINILIKLLTFAVPFFYRFDQITLMV